MLRGTSERMSVASDAVVGLVIFLNFSMRRLRNDRQVLRMVANMKCSDLHYDEESEPKWAVRTYKTRRRSVRERSVLF